MRNTSIDVCKGLGLVAVILGHTSGLPSQIHQAIYSFHMPMFFMIPGFTFGSSNKNRPPLEYMVKRFFRLVTPAWAMGMICGIPFIIFLISGRRGISPEVFQEKLIGTLLGYSKVELNFLTSPIWFLFCLFLIEAMAALLWKISDKQKSLLLMTAGAIGIACFHPIKNLPFGLAGLAIGALFFGIGSLLPATRINSSREAFTNFLLPSLMTFIILIYLAPPEVSVSEGRIGSGLSILTNIALAILGTHLVYCAAKFIESRSNAASKHLATMGAYGLPVIGFNYWINSITTQALGAQALNYWMISFIIQTVALYWVSKLISDSDSKICNIIDGRWRP